ncbi:MAG TPA: acyl-CoA synthetase FdrA [bacterium]|nr:acyl-CoA synthetase FdrA [bacterium]
MIKNVVLKDRYLDSVVLMAVAGKVKTLPGVSEVSAMMGTDSSKGILKGAGILDATGEKAAGGDLIIAMKVENAGVADKVVAAVQGMLEQKDSGGEDAGQAPPRSIAATVERQAGSNLAFFSLPGPFVKREAMAALSHGLNLMIFSDNVTVEEEVALKTRAAELGLLVMGPDCGTAIIGGAALGFANVVPKGPIGIVGASGTGIQQVSCILANRGYGISHAIGLGGRDLSPKVGGIMMRQGIRALAADPDTKLIVLISKPPAPEVAKTVLDVARSCGKKVVVNFLKGDPEEAARRNLPFADSLEAAAELAIATLDGGTMPTREFDDAAAVEALVAKVRPGLTGKYLRGLYSGGTLADEALLLLSRKKIDCYSNLPLIPELALPDNNRSQGNTVVDLGDDEFTRGRPHPMIDFTLRCERIVQEAADPETRVILLDVVTGYGSHPDPAGALVPAIEAARVKAGRQLAFVAAVCGTDGDPQPRQAQAAKLAAAGVLLMPTNAQAARLAARLLA